MTKTFAGLLGASVLTCALGCGSSNAGGGTGGVAGAAAHGATAGNAGSGAHAGTGGHAGTGATAGSGGFFTGGSSGVGGSGAGGFGGSGAGGVGGSGGTTNCAHDLCQQGAPLTADCDPCAGSVCAADQYCCQSGWDDVCIQEASAYCNDLCGSGGFGGMGGYGGYGGGYGGYGGGYGGSGGGGGCNSVTCTSGCCDSTGTCQNTHSNTACGLYGTACLDCTTMGSVCSDSSYTCAECKPNCTNKACGESDGCGGVCKNPCPSGQFCSIGSQYVTNGCQTCNATTCPGGCCSADGQCLGGYERTACGTGGQACADCGAQACVLDQTKWPYGSKCGACGSGCQPSYPGMPAMCQSDGCGNLCPGAACDQTYGASTCTVTDTGAQCMPQGFCDPYMCKSGCCDYSGGGYFGGKCVTGNLPSQCGTGGIQCVDCVAKGGTCDTTKKSCSPCTPDCSSAWSCGQSDGCGGKCTGATGGKCQGASAVCDDKGQCGCAASGQALCYDSTNTTQSCIDVQGDANNCGGCGVKCPSGVACVGGVCQCPSGSLFCKSSDPKQPGACTNLGTDANHCGSCTTQCPGTTCTGGKCGACPSGTTQCGYTNPTCADTTNDPKNCGTCGNVCPSGIACVSGACQCPSGQTSCNAKCTDVQTDAKNCGACYQSCPTGVACAAGKCQCPAGTTLCGTTCTNLAVDPKNCGACNTSCPSGVCNNSKCL